jgi:hypothetical protein
MLLSIAFYASIVGFRRRESDEERRIRSGIMALRTRLGITKAKGFLVSSEHSLALNWMWYRQEQRIIIQHSYIEAATRLSLFLDFDVHKFDAFCLSIQCSDRDGDDGYGGIESSPVAYQALCEWVLEISQQLTTPDIFLPNSNSPSVEISPLAAMNHSQKIKTCPLPEGERFPYFLKLVCKCRIWSESGGALFKKLKDFAEV